VKLTDTPEFRSWFGNSKVVDAAGNPLVVYHGTADLFTKFDFDHPNRKDVGWLGTGIYLTTHREVARSYSLLKVGNHPNVMELYARLENPYLATQQDKERIQFLSIRQGKEAGRAVADAWMVWLKAKGYDGVMLDYTADQVGAANVSQEYVVFDPAGVKSIHNRGTFDSNDGDVLLGVRARSWMRMPGGRR